MEIKGIKVSVSTKMGDAERTATATIATIDVRIPPPDVFERRNVRALTPEAAVASDMIGAISSALDKALKDER